MFFFLHGGNWCQRGEKRKSEWIENDHVEKKAKGNWYKSICRNASTENKGKTQRFKKTRNANKVQRTCKIQSSGAM